MKSMNEGEGAERRSFAEHVVAMTERRASSLARPTVFDRFFAATLLKLLPKRVTPNQITLFRFVSIPLVVWLLSAGDYLSGAVFFFLAALSDALDGALARTTNRITVWGVLADPLADKLLIGAASLLLISRFISYRLALLIVAIEAVTLLLAYYRYQGEAVPAKVPAKIKMILQCAGVFLLFLYVLTDVPALLPASTWILYLAVVFAALSLLVYKSI